MATKKNTNRPSAPGTPPSGGPAPTAAPGGGSPAAALLAALTASPGATTATLATQAGVSAATARKTLSALETAGQARRAPGERTGRGNAPATWHPATSPQPPATPASPTKDTPQTPAGAAGDTAAAPDTGIALKLAEMAATATHHATTALHDGDITTALAELATARDHLTQASREARAATRRHARTGPVMRPGQLRDRVQAHLTANPGTSLTPYEISRVLGNSSGAIANALDKLTEAGHAQLAGDHPRRYMTTTS